MADCSDPGIAESYNDVRNDKTDTTWAVFKYEGKQKIVLSGKGTGGLDELGANFADDESAFAFLRITTGDEESKRAKFVLVSWCGENVGALARAKMSVHKASVKEIWCGAPLRCTRIRLSVLIRTHTAATLLWRSTTPRSRRWTSRRSSTR